MADDIAYDSAPLVLVFADSDIARADWSGRATDAGGRVAAALPIAAASARLDAQPLVEAVLVDLGEGGEGADGLLDRLQAAACEGRHPSVVTLAPGSIDLAAARAPHRDVTLLCGATPAERAAAIGLALAARPPICLHEKTDDSPLQLRRLSEEAARIARALAAMSASEPYDPAPAKAPAAPAAPIALTPAIVRAFIRGRRLRDQYFDAALFADPAWDMLLDLTAARLEGRSVAVSSLCIAAAVPPTTALRWIKTLVDIGLFLRVADPTDGRRVFIEMADAAADAMTSYFAAVEQRSGLHLS